MLCCYFLLGFPIRPGFSWIFFFLEIIPEGIFFPPFPGRNIFDSKKDGAKVPPAAVHRFHDDGRSSQVKIHEKKIQIDSTNLFIAQLKWRTDRFPPSDHNTFSRLFFHLLPKTVRKLKVFSTFFLSTRSEKEPKKCQSILCVFFYYYFPRIGRVSREQWPCLFHFRTTTERARTHTHTRHIDKRKTKTRKFVSQKVCV